MSFPALRKSVDRVVPRVVGIYLFITPTGKDPHAFSHLR